jgi:hypothetical protein
LLSNQIAITGPADQSTYQPPAKPPSNIFDSHLEEDGYLRKSQDCSYENFEQK